MPDDPKVRIAFAADAKYVPHAAAMMHSAAAHCDRSRLEFHFLHDSAVPPAILGELRTFAGTLGVALRCHEIPAGAAAGLPTMGRISAVMWYRVFLADLLPEASRVLYLDCDTIVMGALDELWQMGLGEAWLGAVGNVFMAGKEGHAAQLGLPDAHAYFNSGVLLIDLAAWRRERCGERILALARDPAAGLVWPDQDALNLVFARRWKALHPRWNCQNSIFYFDQAREVFSAAAIAEALAQPGILHFEGGLMSKPWHYLCKHPYREAYFRHRKATPWPDVTIEGRTVLNRLLRPAPLPLQLAALGWIHAVKRLTRRAK